MKNSKEKNKFVEQEEQKKQTSNRSSFTNSMAQNNFVSNNNNNNPNSYDYRKPSILDDNNALSTPQLNKTSVVKHSHLNENRKKSPDEVFCDNACTGALFSYHKRKND